MKCDRCEIEMFKAKMVGAQFVEILLTNKKKAFLSLKKEARYPAMYALSVVTLNYLQMILKDYKSND